MVCTALSQRKSWTDAKSDCVKQGMHLVRVDDASEDAFVRQTALRLNYVGILWIGGSDDANHGKWVWPDGTQFWMGINHGMPVNGRYANWDIGQPNNATGNEHCVAKYASDLWHDDTCVTKYGYVCKQ